MMIGRRPYFSHLKIKFFIILVRVIFLYYLSTLHFGIEIEIEMLLFIAVNSWCPIELHYWFKVLGIFKTRYLGKWGVGEGSVHAPSIGPGSFEIDGNTSVKRS